MTHRSYVSLASPLAFPFALAVTLSGCGAPPSPRVASARTPAITPTAPPSPDAPRDPFELVLPLREEALDLAAPPALTEAFPPPPRGLAPPPSTCAPFVARRAAKALTCEANALDAALAEADVARRDARLLDLEACAALPPGVVRALRAELAPLECGDLLVAPVLASPGVLAPAVHHALFGLGLAARLARSVPPPPVLAPPFDRARVLAFVREPVARWMADVARNVEEISARAARLRGYGRGVAAVEAGIADLRVVERVRAIPVPDGIARDPELKDVYEASLEQVLEPRKARGRDATLVGLADLATAGALHDVRVARARKLLGTLYAGRRIDALDALRLPPLAAIAPLAAASADDRLAQRLPVFYAGLVLAISDPPAQAPAHGRGVDPSALRAMLERGIPIATRAALRGAALTPTAGLLYARARLEMAQLYWRAVDVDTAAAVASATRAQPDATAAERAEATFLLALAIALRGGPDDAAAMMRHPTPDALRLGDTAALDVLARESPPGPYAGLAAFDAAIVKHLTAPRGRAAAYWSDVAQRFRQARELLGDASARADAEARARDADAIAASAAGP